MLHMTKPDTTPVAAVAKRAMPGFEDEEEMKEVGVGGEEV